MPNGVDVDLFRPRTRSDALRRFGVQGDVPVAMFAGTLGFGQGLSTVIDAIQELDRRKKPVCLVLVGHGSERQLLERYVADRSVKRVVFVDSVPLAEVAQFWSGADFGYASLKDFPVFEGARPSKIFPIMASGKPVVYSGAGEAARLIQEAGAGVVAPPEDSIALADVFEGLVDDPELAKRLGENGRRYVEENFTWDAIVDDWLNQLGRTLQHVRQ